VTRDQTEQWLADHGVKYHQLYMRPAGDVAHEYDTKSNLIAAARDDGFNPAIVIDDREDAIRAAIGQGVIGLQVFTP